MTTPAERLSAALADRYRIERELGQGGMATVYLAADLKHDRKVALKVLKPELAAVLGAERFVVEIKTTASLQHPHILPLFDSGTADGFLFYVMPFIEGETLRDKLNRETQLGVDEAVRIAREVADALDYAHGKGVIHRDIKPENILIQNGRPMVADFGIALAVSAAAGGRMTETGLSLGTPHYMSPEQATADKEITGRSDVYSLASVLYEMLAGQPPHLGGSAQQIIMKIIAEPVQPVTALRKSVPSNIAAVLTKALEKLPADRFESARAFADALGNPGFTIASFDGMAARARGAHGVSLRALIGTAVLAIVVGAATTRWIDTRDADVPVAVQFAVSAAGSEPVGTGIGRNLAVSPDGRTVVYATTDSTGRNRLFARAVDDIRQGPIPGTEGATSPFFSPDGLWLGFLAGGQLKKIPVRGGTATRLADLPSMRSASWGRRGIVVCAGDRLMVVPGDGGVPVPLMPGDSTRGYWPVVLPGGTAVVYSTVLLTDGPLGIADLSAGRTAVLGLNGSYPVGVAGGDLIFARSDGALMAAPFDARARRVTGSARVVVTEVLTNSNTGESKVGLSPSGTLAYVTGGSDVQVVVTDVRGEARPLPLPPGKFNNPRYSHDGRRMAADVSSGGRTDVYVYDIASGATQRLTADGTVNMRPEWGQDGKRILYRANRSGGNSTLWWQPADGSGTAEQLVASPGKDIWQGVLSPDGKHVAYRTGTVGDADIVYRRLPGDTAEHGIATTRFNEFGPRISPDGRWVAYYSDESGSNQVYVRPFPHPGAPVPVSVEGGVSPAWSSDGRRIFFVNRNQLNAASVVAMPTLTVAARDVLFGGDFLWSGGHAAYDVSPDGKSFLMLRPVAGKGEEIIVIHNWAAVLRASAKGGRPR